MNHTTSIQEYTHRPGVTYHRPVCSCGWYTKGVTRTREIAEQQAAAHVKRATWTGDFW